jgi:prenyltransferase beta subunit
LLSLFLLSEASLFQPVSALTLSDSITAALNWLISNQQPNGSYGTFSELQVAPAAYALWIHYQDSANVLLSYRFLKNQEQNSSTWFWGGGGNLAEADVPGEILYSFDVSQHLAMLNLLPSVEANLTRFQQTNGGFLGYFDTTLNKQVTSSVDTAMALLGLIGANGITATKEQAAISYLLSLQNNDGSFNLTSTIRSNSLYSLGPEPISMTALVVLTLKSALFTANDPHVSSALSYLNKAASLSFSGHVYAASLSALAFTALYEPAALNQAVTFILSQQNPDGGFRDIIRSSTSSNALDTGWAAVALQSGGSSCCGGGGIGRILMR